MTDGADELVTPGLPGFSQTFAGREADVRVRVGAPGREKLRLAEKFRVAGLPELAISRELELARQCGIDVRPRRLAEQLARLPPDSWWDRALARLWPRRPAEPDPAIY
jgi:hypothetical protein